MSVRLADLVLQAAGSQPGKVALLTPDGQPVSYGALVKTVQAFSVAAQKQGVEPGDTIAIEIKNYAVYICLFLALRRLGAVPVIAGSAKQVIEDGLALTAVIAEKVSAETRIRSVQFGQNWFEMTDEPAVPPDFPDPAPAMIATSSGTTGTRRYMAFSDSQILERIRSFEAIFGSKPRRRLIGVGKRTAVGNFLTFQTLLAGGYLARPAENPAKTLQLIRDQGIEEIFASPGTVIELAECAAQTETDPGELDCIWAIGSAIAPQAAIKAGEQLRAEIRISYGSTETGPVAEGALDELADIAGAAGRVASIIDIRAEDDDGLDLPVGQSGRLKIRIDPTRMVDSYINSPDGQNGSFRDGWFYPGDIGAISEDGILVLTGRTSELINLGGDKIAPERVESMAYGHPGLRLAVAFGAPNRLGFDDICLAAVVDPGFDAESLRAALGERLGQNVVVRIVQVGAIPVNAAGKTDRAELRSRYAAAI